LSKDAEDALITALNAKAEYPEAPIMYIRREIVGRTPATLLSCTPRIRVDGQPSPPSVIDRARRCRFLELERDALELS
jgi:hypothetical protein